MNYILWAVTAIALLVSASKNKAKTIKSLKIAFKRLKKITPLFLVVMTIYALTVSCVSTEFIDHTIGQGSGMVGMFIALGLGSIALMPGFAAFPLCAGLLSQGVSYTVLATFSMALMNVGIVTFPLEVKYLGIKVAIVRNVIGIIISLLTGLIVGIGFGEITF
ncbi:MAG: hypothetical protein JEZ07_14270 [Phycisphaerae bacterium]|nr:hypothetical protein [Phycisphaerae bacterium]